MTLRTTLTALSALTLAAAFAGGALAQDKAPMAAAGAMATPMKSDGMKSDGMKSDGMKSDDAMKAPMKKKAMKKPMAKAGDMATPMKSDDAMAKPKT